MELEDLVGVDLRVWEEVEVEWSADVLVGLLLPSECAQPHLEGVHPQAIVSQLLVSVFQCVVLVAFVFESH